MRNWQSTAGVWFYGLGTALTGVLELVWRSFDASHQPFQSLGRHVPEEPLFACVAGILLLAAGVALLWPRSAKIGAGASAIAYLAFVALWLPRYYTGIHALGWRFNVVAGVSFGVAQQLMLLAPAVMLYLTLVPRDAVLQGRAAVATRWMLGLPPVLFGLFHLVAIRIFATIVPKWMGLGYFWAALTGIAFILAGIAICSGVKDVLAARLLALMLLLFEGLVEIPPVFVRVHNQVTWGAAVYNLTAIGACLIFAEFAAGRANRNSIDSINNLSVSRPERIVA
jgi:uncharacterized membrane protein